jgi:hypothetical protein
MPLSQKMHCWSSPSAHCEIFCKTSTWVLGRQVGQVVFDKPPNEDTVKPREIASVVVTCFLHEEDTQDDIFAYVHNVVQNALPDDPSFKKTSAAKF